MVRDSPIVELGVASPDWIALDGEPPHAGNGNFVCVGIVCDVCAPTPWERVQSFVMNRARPVYSIYVQQEAYFGGFFSRHIQ